MASLRPGHLRGGGTPRRARGGGADVRGVALRLRVGDEVRLRLKGSRIVAVLRVVAIRGGSVELRVDAPQEVGIRRVHHQEVEGAPEGG